MNNIYGKAFQNKQLYLLFKVTNNYCSMQFFLYIIFYPLIWIISRMPFWILYRFSDFLYFIMYKIIRYRIAVVRNNLKIAFPEKTAKERKQIEKRFYRHFADLFVEMIKAFYMPLHQMQQRFVFNNVDLLNEISRKGKSVVVVGGHYANWEWVFSLAAMTEAFPIATYLKINNPYFEKLMLKNRQRFGGKLVETKQLRRKLHTYVNSDKKFILGLLSDQSPQLHRAKYWRLFFGREVPVFTGQEELAKQYDTAFVFMAINKLKRGYYEVNFELITLQPNDYADYKLTDIYLEKLEQQIKQEPAYYLWTHRRFKHAGRKNEV
jgi:KDO2-lipid IV(A) lauroyltransferase